MFLRESSVNLPQSSRNRPRLADVDPRVVEGNWLTELAAYLALHREWPRTRDPPAAGHGCLGRGRPPPGRGYISRLRTWLGRDADGELYVSNVDARHGGYHVSEGLGNDWTNLHHLAWCGLARSEFSIPAHHCPGGPVPVEFLAAAGDGRCDRRRRSHTGRPVARRGTG